MRFGFIVGSGISRVALAALPHMTAVPWLFGGTMLVGRVDDLATVHDHVTRLRRLGLSVDQVRPLLERRRLLERRWTPAGAPSSLGSGAVTEPPTVPIGQVLLATRARGSSRAEVMDCHPSSGAPASNPKTRLRPVT